MNNDYELIQARKLPATDKVVLMRSLKNQNTGKPSLTIKLTGDWLPEFGFAPDDPVIVIYKPGRITFQPRNVIKKCSDLFLAWRSQMELIQVRETFDRGKSYPYIIVFGPCLEKTGFRFDDVLFASCERGFITLQRLDFKKIGF